MFREPPLVQAILEDNLQKTEELLISGAKLEIENMWFLKDNPAIIDLLEKYQALPKDVTASTIKFIFYVRGSKKITDCSFLSSPDLNKNGCPGMATPISIATQMGNLAMVKNLIGAGVTERPLYHFTGIHELYFLDALNIDQGGIANIKNKINQILDWYDLNCKIAEIFITNPDAKLLTKLEAEPQLEEQRNYRFLTFFAWLARNDRVDILNNQNFQKLFRIYSIAAGISIIIAVAFGSNKYVDKGIPLLIDKIETNVFRAAINIAIEMSDQDLLLKLVNTLNGIGITLKNLQSQIKDLHAAPGSYLHDDPLLKAIYTNNPPAASYLLEHGADPNHFIKKGIFFPDYLTIAHELQRSDMVTLLKKYGADADIKPAPHSLWSKQEIQKENYSEKIKKFSP